MKVTFYVKIQCICMKIFYLPAYNFFTPAAQKMLLYLRLLFIHGGPRI